MIIIENEKLKISINPLGAELSNAVLKENGRDYIWEGDPTVWSGHAPILFPICGRLAKDTFYINGDRYTMAKHGFARRREFDLLEVEETRASFVLRSDAKTKMQYPFDFEFAVSFSLDGSKLKTVYSTVNTGGETMYFSVGAHPAFSVGLGGRVVFPIKDKIETLTVSSDGLINGIRTYAECGESVTLTEDVFQNDAIILPSPKFESADLCDKNGKKLVTMRFGKVPYLLMWAKPGAPFVCIEPWHGIPDDVGEPHEIKDKKAIIKLAAGERFDFETEIEFFA